MPARPRTIWSRRFKGVATREDAERLNGIELYIAREKLPATDDDEYYHADLIGLAAVNAADEPLGRVIAIHNFGAGDIIEIAPPHGPTHAAAVHQCRGADGRPRGRPCRDRAARGNRRRRRSNAYVMGSLMTWRATVLTLFPEMFPGPLGVSLAGKALASGLWALEARDIRDSATDRHRSVDDTPAGGGPGMVLRADVLAAAIDAADTGARPAAPADEPAGSAIDPVAGDGTRRRSRAADRLRPVRGHRRAGDRGPRARGGLDRGLRAVRRRNRRHGR